MNDEQKLKEVQKIIQKYFAVLENLPKGGKIPPQLAEKMGIPREVLPIIHRAYHYGHLKGEEKARISNKELEQRLSREMATTPFLRVVEDEFSDSLKNSLDKTRERLSRALYEEYKKNLRLVDEVFTDEKIPRRYMAGILREVTGDRQQDFDLVLKVELMNNALYGQAHRILAGGGAYGEEKGETMVFKRPNPDACPHCVKHYLEKDKVTPKLFKLSELMANGSNYGKKVADWKPTLGPLHPNCQCQLGVMPNGSTFNENGQIVVKKVGDRK